MNKRKRIRIKKKKKREEKSFVDNHKIMIKTVLFFFSLCFILNFAYFFLFKEQIIPRLFYFSSLFIDFPTIKKLVEKKQKLFIKISKKSVKISLVRVGQGKEGNKKKVKK